MEFEVTTEHVVKSVSAAFDSVNILNELKVKETLTEEEIASVTRNTDHIKIMLAFDWFVNALTPEQKTELQAI